MLIPLFLISTLALQSHASFQKAQEIHVALEARNPSYGGYALAEDPCPANLGSCPDGKCCPLNTYCKIAGTLAGYACCPDTNDCVHAVQAAPACAEDSWVLWYGVNGYFCCLQGEIGILPSKGQTRVGFCVRGDVPVSAQQTATLVAPAKVSGSVSLATGVSLPTGSGSVSVTSAAPSSIPGVTGTATVSAESTAVTSSGAAPSSMLGVTGTATVNSKSVKPSGTAAAASATVTGAGPESAKVILPGMVGVVSHIFLAFFRDMLR
ncbi:hypothetical protein K432DRAFT_399167 [Lepidopterella palustris CBS 459.81]|uniref:Uncharacterized protein n=1 Tax=Lepidopterella palustris CBS 459.81 TaxID=1314670 RepID=A0A8E2DWP9_9PEZI|nr:hypothetical protein K432DRAFT_399167 [Lepidopterella palustris CBS 459.81]